VIFDNEFSGESGFKKVKLYERNEKGTIVESVCIVPDCKSKKFSSEVVGEHGKRKMATVCAECGYIQRTYCDLALIKGYENDEKGEDNYYRWKDVEEKF
jgi:hypothetical protein